MLSRIRNNSRDDTTSNNNTN